MLRDGVGGVGRYARGVVRECASMRRVLQSVQVAWVTGDVCVDHTQQGPAAQCMNMKKHTSTSPTVVGPSGGVGPRNPPV